VPNFEKKTISGICPLEANCLPK